MSPRVPPLRVSRDPITQRANVNRPRVTQGERTDNSDIYAHIYIYSMVRIVHDELIGVQLSSCFVTVFDTRSLVELLFRSFSVYHLLFLTRQTFKRLGQILLRSFVLSLIIIMIFFLFLF